MKFKKLNNGEIKNKTKFAKDGQIERATLNSICASSNNIIADYDARHKSN